MTSMIRPGMFVFLDDDRETVYRVNNTSPGEQWASLRTVFPDDGDDPNSVKWGRCTPVKAEALATIVRDLLGQAKMFADAMLYAPR